MQLSILPLESNKTPKSTHKSLDNYRKYTYTHSIEPSQKSKPQVGSSLAVQMVTYSKFNLGYFSLEAKFSRESWKYVIDALLMAGLDKQPV